MLTHITAFIFYTLAMIGILLVGFVVYKKMNINMNASSKGLIKILDNYPIAPKKTLMVVKILDEKFLIASGAEHTTFLAKLEDNTCVSDVVQKAKDTMSDVAKKPEITINEIQKPTNIQQNNSQGKIDELQQARLQKLQKQFNALYEQDDKEVLNNTPRQKNQKILTKILQELNATQNKA